MERLHQRLHKLNERQRRHSHLVQVYRGVPETRKSHTDSTHAEHCYKTDRYCQQRDRMKGWESYERQPGHKPPKSKTHSCSAPLNLQRKRQISFISQLFLKDNSEIKMRTKVKKCASGILQFEKTHMCRVVSNKHFKSNMKRVPLKKAVSLLISIQTLQDSLFRLIYPTNAVLVVFLYETYK